MNALREHDNMFVNSTPIILMKVADWASIKFLGLSYFGIAQDIRMLAVFRKYSLFFDSCFFKYICVYVGDELLISKGLQFRYMLYFITTMCVF